jgi:hypothetical protein
LPCGYFGKLDGKVKVSFAVEDRSRPPAQGATAFIRSNTGFSTAQTFSATSW